MSTEIQNVMTKSIRIVSIYLYKVVMSALMSVCSAGLENRVSKMLLNDFTLLGMIKKELSY